MNEWLTALHIGDPAVPVALVSVLATEGSAPRGAGARMLVTPTASHGTIGGGALEYRAVEQARAISMRAVGSWRIQDYPLGPMLGQCCGGRVRLLIEHVDRAQLAWLADVDRGRALITRLAFGHVERAVAADTDVAAPSARGEPPGPGDCFAEPIGGYRRPLYLFGAGHVGQAIVHHARSLPLRIAWFDPRMDFAGIDGVTSIPDLEIAGCVNDAPDDAAILIMTHDHALDYSLAKAALLRPPPAFIGLIGSATKRARFRTRFAHDGLSLATMERLTCPIGVEGVTGKEPDIIAIAVLAQLLSLDMSAPAETAHDVSPTQSV